MSRQDQSQRSSTSKKPSNSRRRHVSSNSRELENVVIYNSVGFDRNHNHSHMSAFEQQESRQRLYPGSNATTLTNDSNSSMAVQPSWGSQYQNSEHGVTRNTSWQQYSVQENGPNIDARWAGAEQSFSSSYVTEQHAENVNERAQGTGLGNQDQDNREPHLVSHMPYGFGSQFGSAPFSPDGNSYSVNSSTSAHQHRRCQHGDSWSFCLDPYCPYHPRG